MKKAAGKTCNCAAAEQLAALETVNRRYISYIREKTDQLLTVMGTESLRQEELDDQALLEFDPIGIMIDSFAQVLEYHQENINHLQQARDELQAIFDATGVGISIIDRDFIVQRCNERQRQLLVDPGLVGVPGHPCYEIYCSRQDPGLDCPAIDTFATGRAVQVRGVKKKNKYFQVVTTPFERDENGEVTKVIEVSLDITEKKKAEDAEKEQREQYLTEKSKLATVIESLTEGLLVLDPQDVVTAFNRAAGEITNRAGHEILGQPLRSIFPGAGPLLQDEEGDRQGVEISCPAVSERGGDESIFSVNLGRLYDSEGRRIGRVVTFRDITEGKKRQELFYRTEKLAAVGQLSAGVAHELNTPLCGILGYARLLLKEKGLSGTQRERLEIIVEQAQKSSAIINGLLSFAQHSKNAPNTRIECDLNTIIDRALPVLATELDKRAIEIKVDLRPLPAVVAEPGELEQVVLNLVLNAMQAIRRAGRIDIRTRQQGTRVIMELADTGPGVPEEIRSRIFDPFYTTKPIGEGTGLGLSICSGIISELGGAIEVAGNQKGGATFTVILPARSADQDINS